MEITSKIIFGDIRVKNAYLKLKEKNFFENQLKSWLDSAFEKLTNDAFSGIQIKKRLIPKEYLQRFGNIDNLWKLDLPEGWRLIYTIKKEEIFIFTIILEWLSHKEYEKRFKY